MENTEHKIDFDFGKITVLEEEPKKDEGNIFAHIYKNGINGSYCGLESKNDKHAKSHEMVSYVKDSQFCHLCGTPICPECLRIREIVRKFSG